jgi:tetratricopeptide (TPR) repeat protein
MSGMPLKLIVTIAALAGIAPHAWASGVVKITLPRRSELTPVQRLNREGVEAVNKRNYEKAAALFYKAYLYDPADPFTLNNLGYISEFQGELERAQKFYALASEQGSNANIDRSNAKLLVGKPMQYAFQSLQNSPMQVNRMNVDAMDLLAAGRRFESVAMLQKALALDPRNPFTMNNLGVAEESVGDYDTALKFYGSAAGTNSKETVVVTADRAWRGRPVSTMAAANAGRLEERMKNVTSAKAHAAMLALRGVTASNGNDLASAKEDFLHAYELDPASAFSLNNRGFVAEMDGDLESAEFFYEKALRAGDAGALVGVATQRDAEGKKLLTVAASSDRQIDTEIDKYSQERRRETGPVELTPRGNNPTLEQSPH